MSDARPSCTRVRRLRAAGARAALLLCVACLSSSAAPGAAPGPAAGPDYDLAVLVIARDPHVALVGLGYSRSIDHKLLEESIDKLMARAHGRAEQLVIEDSPLGEAPVRLVTEAQFAAPGLIDREGGVLPVGVIARSLPEWRRMRLAFLVEEQFPFHGPGDASADGLVVKLINDMQAYEYDVERNSEPTAAPTTPEPVRPKPVSPLPAALIGMPTGFLLGWVFGERRGRTV